MTLMGLKERKVWKVSYHGIWSTYTALYYYSYWALEVLLSTFKLQITFTNLQIYPKYTDYWLGIQYLDKGDFEM